LYNYVLAKWNEGSRIVLLMQKEGPERSGRKTFRIETQI
jgi:hypothetical protein